MTDYMTFVEFILAIFVAGITVGKLVEKIERYFREKDNEKDAHKNDRR